MKTQAVYKTPGKYHDNGSYGDYFIMDAKKKIGIKVLHRTYNRKNMLCEFQNILDQLVEYGEHEDFHHDSSIWNIIQEYVVLQMLEPLKEVPRAIGLTFVERCGKYSIGIMMEHISGHTLWKMDEDGKLTNCFGDRFNMKARKLGFNIDDWHQGNIIHDGKTFYRIDFSPGHFSTIRKSEFNQRVTHEFIALMERAPFN